MNFTEYAKEKLLNNELEIQHTVRADLKIKFRHSKNGKKIFADVFISEQKTGIPLFVVEENIPIHDRGEIILQSVDGIISTPVEVT